MTVYLKLNNTTNHLFTVLKADETWTKCLKF